MLPAATRQRHLPRPSARRGTSRSAGSAATRSQDYARAQGAVRRRGRALAAPEPGVRARRDDVRSAHAVEARSRRRSWRPSWPAPRSPATRQQQHTAADKAQATRDRVPALRLPGGLDREAEHAEQRRVAPDAARASTRTSPTWSRPARTTRPSSRRRTATHRSSRRSASSRPSRMAKTSWSTGRPAGDARVLLAS